jgi:ABC-2 type transport system permease protein
VGQRSVLVTFAQEPRRLRVVAAKVVSGLGLSLLGSAYAFGTAAAALALSDALGRQVAWQPTWRMVAGIVTFVLLNSLLGMAFGALFLNTPAAIVLFFVLPTAWTLISYGWLERWAAGSTPPKPSGTSSNPTGTTTAARSWSRSPSGSPCPSR